MTTAVKFFHSGMSGSPVMSGTAGAMIAVLDACLINGFGLKTVDTLVVSGGIATASISTGHSAVEDCVVLISGATPSGLNGEKRVLSRTTNTVVFDATGISNQTATGTITLKIAPAGWEKQFSGTNLGAYRSTDSAATKFPLRVDDTGTRDARVVGYESMTDVNTGSSPFPTSAQRSGGSYWPKSQEASSSARPWMLVADGLAFYLHVDYDYANFPNTGFAVFYGDMLPNYSGDTYCCALHGYGSSFSDYSNASSTSNLLYVHTTLSYNETWLARSYSGVGSSTQGLRNYDSPNVSSATGSSGSVSRNVVPYPNPMDGALLLSTFRLYENSTKGMRATFPGLYASPQRIPDGTFNTTDPLTGVPGLTGRTLRTIIGYDAGGSMSKGFIDVTGPWR